MKLIQIAKDIDKLSKRKSWSVQDKIEAYDILDRLNLAKSSPKTEDIWSDIQQLKNRIITQIKIRKSKAERGC